MQELEGITSTILHKEVKGRERIELTFLSVSCVIVMGLNLPHKSSLLILNNIRKVTPEKSHSRDTDTWCYSGIEPALLDHQASF